MTVCGYQLGWNIELRLQQCPARPDSRGCQRPVTGLLKRRLNGLGHEAKHTNANIHIADLLRPEAGGPMFRGMLEAFDREDALP